MAEAIEIKITKHDYGFDAVAWRGDVVLRKRVCMDTFEQAIRAARNFAIEFDLTLEDYSEDDLRP